MNSEKQLKILNQSELKIKKIFNLLNEYGLPTKPNPVEYFQINVGKVCNQTCRHCHVDASPRRKESMSLETFTLVLEALKKSSAHTVDITGGAPEMNPHFKWFIESISKLKKKIIVRCNLTIIEANPSYHYLPDFFCKHNINIISSLPFYEKNKTDKQRGDGVFEKSISALKKLNAVGFGQQSSSLILDLVYNPSGAFLPATQSEIEKEFKLKLKKEHGVVFNRLYTITNMPISRFLEFLLESGNFENYMDKLYRSFNPAVAQKLMCLNTISVSWDGFLYDCDFNQMLDLNIKYQKKPLHISNYDESVLKNRNIIYDQHCYGCTSGNGSSCGGSII